MISGYVYIYVYVSLYSNRLYTPDIILQRERQDRKYYPVASLHFCELRSNAGKVSSQTASVMKTSTDRRIRLFAVMNTSVTLVQSNLSKNKKNENNNNPPSILRELDTAGVVVFDTSLSSNMTPGSRRLPHILDEKIGVSHPSCATFMKETSELIIARTDGVFSYSIEDRGGAAGIEGYKQCICAIGRYVLVGVTDSELFNENSRTSITIYDLRSKIISFYYQLPVGDKVLFCLQDGSKLLL